MPLSWPPPASVAAFSKLDPLWEARQLPLATRRSITPTPGCALSRTELVISEIMYHPRYTNSGEFVELFNAQAFFENIGGYRLSGDIEYTFPPNTIIPSGGFIVVAKDPAYMQTTCGLANALGPFSGSLPNDHGTVRLRNRQGAVMLEVIYQTGDPWPIAPDGTGHSLVLAKASYGEGDPRA